MAAHHRASVHCVARLQGHRSSSAAPRTGSAPALLGLPRGLRTEQNSTVVRRGEQPALNARVSRSPGMKDERAIERITALEAVEWNIPATQL